MSASPTSGDGPAPHECARRIVDAFARYNAEFRAITRRAPLRFDARDWKGSQRDAVERIELYDRFVNQTIAELREALGAAAQDRALWRRIRHEFAAQITDLPDPEFTKTFFSSISRRLFGTVGVAPDIEFVATDLDPLADIHSAVGSNTYLNHGSLSLLFEDLLGDVRFRSPWRDLDKSIAHVASEVRAHLHARGERRLVEKVEVIRPVFYQISRAYVVGRLVGRGFVVPLVIALRNSDGGVLVDAVMLAEDDVSIVFSFTRSYFHADLERVAEAVVFLKSIMPRKPVSELFTVLGRARQGKTERYRELMRNLEHTRDQFVHAPGERGLVMVCFTLPSFDVVFKVIRDRFPYPKTVLREEVMAKYRHGVRPRPRRAAGGRAGISPPALSARALRARAARGAAARDRRHGPRGRRRPGIRSHVHRAAHDAAQPVPAQRAGRGRRARGARLRAVHP